jgi:hypothetical protein
MRSLPLREKSEDQAVGMGGAGVIDDILEVGAGIGFVVGNVTEFHQSRTSMREAKPVFFGGGKTMAGFEKGLGRRFLNLAGKCAKNGKEDEREASH